MGGTPQVASSLIAGKVDAGVSGESSVLLIHQGKMKQLPGASAREMKILSSGAPLITTRRYISRDRRSVMQFMRAYVEGVHYFKTTKKLRYGHYRNSCAERRRLRLGFSTMTSAMWSIHCRFPATKHSRPTLIARTIRRR